MNIGHATTVKVFSSFTHPLHNFEGNDDIQYLGNDDTQYLKWCVHNMQSYHIVHANNDNDKDTYSNNRQWAHL